MAVVKTTIATNLASTFTFPSSGHLLRDFDGVLYALTNGRSDIGSGVKSNIYTSTDGGSTWNLLAMDTGLGGPGTGGFQPSLMLSMDNEVHLGVWQSNGVAKFEVFKRGVSSWSSVWDYTPTGIAPAAADRVVFKIGKTRVPGAGTVATFHLCWAQSGGSNVWYMSNLLTVPEPVGYGATHTGYTQPDMAIDRNGFVHFVLDVTEVTSGDVNVWYARRSEPWRYNLERVSPAGAHDTIGSEAIICLQNTTPVVLYTMRDAASGAVGLYLAHRGRSSSGGWKRAEVWDGLVRLDHSPGANCVTVDQLNRPYVLARAVPTDNGAGEYESTIYERSGTTWSPTFLSSQNLSVTVPNAAMYDDAYRAASSSPSRPLRGYAVMYWEKNGSNRDLIYARPDTIAFDDIVAGAEDVPYRVPPVFDRDSVVLAGESEAAAQAFPSEALPGYGWREERSFMVSDLRMDVGYSTRMSLLPDARRHVQVKFEPMTKSDRDTLETFLVARNIDEESFDLALPARGVTLRVLLDSNTVQLRKLSDDVYDCEFSVVEVFVPPDRTLILGRGEVAADYPGE